MEWCQVSSTEKPPAPPVLSIPETAAVSLDILSPAGPPGGASCSQTVTLLAAPAEVYQEVPEDSPAQPPPPVENTSGPEQLLFEVRPFYPASQPEGSSYSQDLAPIQGDPLLSEASVCIELQKSIEAASVNSPEQSQLGSEIPRDQQWVNTPQTTDWT